MRDGKRHLKGGVKILVTLGLCLGVTVGCLGMRGAPPAVPLNPIRWILAYAGWQHQGHSAYSVDDLVRELAVVDSGGTPTRWLESGVLFTQTWATSGRGFYPGLGTAPADGGDWQQYTDSLFDQGGAVDRLDSAVRFIRSRIGGGPEPLPIGVVIPYPDTGARVVTFQGANYPMSLTDGRLGLVKAYMQTVRDRFSGKHYAAVQLWAFYWLREDCYAYDTMLVKGMIKAAHDGGTKAFWVPFFHANNFTHWRGLGFDEAWLQPNFFFHPEIPNSRVDSAVSLARTNRMGMELELDRRLLTTPAFFDRLTPYLDAFQKSPDLRDRPIVVYDGAGAIIDLSKSNDPRLREVYRRLTAVLSPPPSE